MNFLYEIWSFCFHGYVKWGMLFCVLDNKTEAINEWLNSDIEAWNNYFVWPLAGGFSVPQLLQCNITGLSCQGTMSLSHATLDTIWRDLLILTVRSRVELGQTWCVSDSYVFSYKQLMVVNVFVNDFLQLSDFVQEFLLFLL